MVLVEFTIPGKLIINLCSPAIKSNVLVFKAFITCSWRASSPSLHIRQMGERRGSQDGIFRNKRMTKSGFLLLVESSFHGVLSTAAGVFLFVCFVRGLGRVEASPCIQYLGASTLTLCQNITLIIKETSHTLTMSADVFHSVLLSLWPSRHADSGQILQDLTVVLRMLLFILSIMRVYWISLSYTDMTVFMFCNEHPGYQTYSLIRNVGFFRKFFQNSSNRWCWHRQGQGSAKLFCKGRGGKSLRLCQPYGL